MIAWVTKNKSKQKTYSIEEETSETQFRFSDNQQLSELRSILE